jgi:hypothetical protein
MAERSDFLTAVEDNLQDFGMQVSRGVELPDGSMADLFASRTYFSWKGLVLLSQHVAVRDYAGSTATPKDAKALFDVGFRQAKKVNRVPLLRGMQFGFMVIPCLVVATADRTLIEYAEHSPRKHWSLFEFPVVVDRSTGRTHYYHQAALWGAFFFSDMQDLVERCIVAAKFVKPSAVAERPREHRFPSP